MTAVEKEGEFLKNTTLLPFESGVGGYMKIFGLLRFDEIHGEIRNLRTGDKNTIWR